MENCSTCGEQVPDKKVFCPYCGTPIKSRENEVIKEIKSYKDNRNQMLGLFLLGMFGIWILPFRNLKLVLAIISFGIAPTLSIYYTWKKRQAEKKLEKPLPK